MGRIDKIINPVDGSPNPIALEDNAVLLSGYCSELGHIRNGMLFALSGPETFQALYDDQDDEFTTEEFSIGTPIYVYKGTTVLNDVQVHNLKAYISYYDVPLSVNGVDIDQHTGDYFDNYGDVWLQVQISSDYARWKPVAIVGTKGLVVKCFYIYLGSFTGDLNGQLQTDIDHFMLETENQMYYFDDTSLIKFEDWRLKNHDSSITSFYTVGNAQGVGTCSTDPVTENTTAMIGVVAGYQLAKNYVTITFAYDVPANATLNINSQGAKAIYQNPSTALLAGTIKSQDKVLFYYDGRHYVIANISDRHTLVTSIGAGSQDYEYPSAKCVYDIIGNVEALLAAI